MQENEVLEKLRSAGAVLSGHFRLSSGLHSDAYVQCALALCRPLLAEELGEALAQKMGYPDVDAVVGPALGGVVMAVELARALSRHYHREILALFTEREAETMTLRRGFSIEPRDRVIMVEDVVTTGKSILEAAEVVKSRGGEIAGWGSLVNRSGGAFVSKPALVSLITMDLIKYQPEDCPLCKDGIPVIKPGSRPDSK